MDIPVVTDEQRERFEPEFAEVNLIESLTPEAAWVLARAYSEMQIQNLLGVPYSCQQCGADTVNVAAPPDVDLQCPKCGWVPVEVKAVSQGMPIVPGEYKE